MKRLKLVDDVIEEPLAGAHRHQEEMFERVKGKIKSYLNELDPKDPKTRIDERIEKFNSMGVWNG
jgi:acetyl-CoA carboxylase carboxyl transferase subunit alpha